MSRRGFLMGMGAVGVGLVSAGEVGGMRVVKKDGRAMGADVSMVVLHRERGVGERAVEAAFEELSRVEGVMSLYRGDSQVSELNREGVVEGADERLVEVLEAAGAYSRRTGGAFDVTVQPLWEIWAAAKKAGRLPTAEEVAAARRLVDWRKVEVSKGRVRMGKGMKITLNGIAQGYAGDRVMKVLRGAGIEHALVNTGEIGAMGRREDGEAWRVGVQHPRIAEAYVAVAKLEGRFMATSGDYATAFGEDRVNHHIFDPKTGRSPRELASATVVARRGAEADAMTKAMMVMGWERGVRVVRESGGEALGVMKDGGMVETGGFPRG